MGWLRWLGKLSLKPNLDRKVKITQIVKQEKGVARIVQKRE